jgi:hypothetical protein
MNYFFLLFRNFFIKIFYKSNYIIRKIVEEEKVLLLIKSFKIYKTNHKLIRLGDLNDGGYLIPDDLNEISASFTGGVGSTVKFEYDLAAKGIKCFVADYSVESLPLPSFPIYKSVDKNIVFIKKFLGDKNDDLYIDINQWLSKNTKINEDYILKLDVEGDEYKLLSSITEDNLSKMRIIIFEIHNFTNILHPLGFEVIKFIFDRLQKKHSIVHIHPNNVSPAIRLTKKLTLYDQLEITLLRNDRIFEKDYAKEFPHPLDSKNKFFFKSQLPDCFYL